MHSDGRDVDIELGELRYGERKEMLVELELDNADIAFELSGQAGGNRRTLNATDQFNQRMGLDTLLNGDSPDLVEGMIDRMIDEVPVFEVDGSFLRPFSWEAGHKVGTPGVAHSHPHTAKCLPGAFGSSSRL